MNAITAPVITEVASLRLRLWDAGFRPVALKTGDKMPVVNGWPERARRKPPADAEDAPTTNALNTGILCDGLRVLDFDVDDADIVRRLRALAGFMLGETCIRTRSNSPRLALIYRAAAGDPVKRAVKGTLGGVEVLGKGNQLHAYGRHPSGVDLRWDSPPHETPVDTLPAVSEAQISSFLAAAAPLIGAETAPVPHQAEARNAPAASSHGLKADDLDVAAALSVIPNNGVANWETWNTVGLAVFTATGGDETGRAAWHSWSKRSPSYDEAATEARWKHYAAHRDRQMPAGKAAIGAGSLFRMAAEARPGWTKPSQGTKGPSGARPQADDEADGRPPEYTDESLAVRFTEAYSGRLRYVAAWGRWYEWTGTVWRQDDTMKAFDLSRGICRHASSECNKGQVAAVVASAKTVAAVERLAKADRQHAATVDQWDADPWLLGTPGGTIDLRTGQLRAADPADHITRLTAVAPAATPDCPMWLAFMDQVTGNDATLIRFLRQWCGYCLTGDIREHALLFAHGPGGNGKGVFLNTVSRIMGDYARTAAMETFTASTGDKHPTDLAMLRGARLVTASETEEGRAWAEARIKAMTGGDPITARFMRQDFFEYMPQFKLTIIGNHKPILRNIDDAVRRRFNMAPFVFKPEKPDMELEAKLRTEWPAVLRWMIEGCLDWQMHGLVKPKVVADATAEYFSEQDTVTQWVEDCCTRSPTQSDTAATLFKSWSDYAVANGEKPGSSKWFTQALLRLGCEPVKNTPGEHGKRGFKGISLIRSAPRSHYEPGEE